MLTAEREDEWKGRCEQFSEAVARACMERPGLRGLAGCVLTYVASFGEVCFQTYTAIAKKLGCHPESVGRVMRWLADLGYLDHTRVGPGQRPKTEKARWFSPHGTTENRIEPTRLGVKRIAKALRSKLRTQAAQVLAPVAALAAMTGTPVSSRPAPAPKHSAPLASLSSAELAERKRNALEALAAFERDSEPASPSRLRLTTELELRILDAAIDELDTGPPE